MRKTKLKSFFKEDGYILNKKGLEVTEMVSKNLNKLYSYWLDKNYSPSEIRELLFNQIFQQTTFINAIRSCK